MVSAVRSQALKPVKYKLSVDVPFQCRSLPKTQHCCQRPFVFDKGLQCHIQPSARRFAPMFSVFVPKPSRDVRVFVASFAKVPMISVAWQTQGSFLSRYGACFAHSAHAIAWPSSGIPRPLGSWACAGPAAARMRVRTSGARFIAFTED